MRRMAWSKFEDHKILVGVQRCEYANMLLMLLIHFWGFVMLYGSYEKLAGCLLMWDRNKSLRVFEFDLEIHSVLACFILQTDTSKISCLLFVIYTPITKDNVVRVCNQHKRTEAHMLQLCSYSQAIIHQSKFNKSSCLEIFMMQFLVLISFSIWNMKIYR
jgi:hypothetical protein